MDRHWLETRKTALQARIDDLTRQQREIVANIHACTGALQLCDEQLSADGPVLTETVTPATTGIDQTSTTAPDGVTLDVPPAGAA